MTHHRCLAVGAITGIAAFLTTGPCANAQVIDAYELTGVNAPVSSVPSSTLGFGINGVSMKRSSSLSDVSGSTNCFNSAGWNSSTGIVSLGFQFNSSEYVTLNGFEFGDRSSATGPGSMDVLFSVDGGAFVKYDTIVQPSTTYVDTDLTFAPITVKNNFTVEFVATPGSTAANGGAIGSSGSWRLTDYENNSATFFAVQLDGTITPTPEPTGFSFLAGMSLVGVSVLRKRRRRV